MGTPTEKTWPGVRQLPDYKDSFPHWLPQDLNDHVLGLDEDGIDLLEVRLPAYPSVDTSKHHHLTVCSSNC